MHTPCYLIISEENIDNQNCYRNYHQHSTWKNYNFREKSLYAPVKKNKKDEHIEFFSPWDQESRIIYPNQNLDQTSEYTGVDILYLFA